MQLALSGISWLFTIYIPLIAWYGKHRSAFRLSVHTTVNPYAGLPRSYKEYLIHLLFRLRLAAIGCVIIVLARPQTRDSWRTSSTEGTDIVLALDISSSMLARDFTPDRFEAAKDVAARCHRTRRATNIGLTILRERVLQPSL